MLLLKKISGKKSVLDYSVTVGSRALNRLATLVISVLIARMMGAEDLGTYSLFFGIFILIYEAQTGSNISYVRFAKLSESEDKSKILKISLSIQLIIALFLIVAGWPLALLLSKILSLERPEILYVGFIASGLLSLFRIWFGVFQERGQFGRLGICSFSFNIIVLLTLSCIFLFSKNISLSCVFIIYLGISSVMGLASMIVLWTKTRGYLLEKSSFMEMSRMTFLNMTVSFTYFVYHGIDVFFLKYFLDLQSVGIYAAALKTSMLLNILTGALATILLPKAIEGIKSSEHLRNYLVKSYYLSFYILILFAGFFILAPYALNLIFGDAYIEGLPILRLLILGWGINVLYIPIMQLFYAINKVGLRLVLEIFKVSLTVISFIILIPKIGAIGAAWALLIGISITVIVASFVIYFSVNKHVSDST